MCLILYIYIYWTLTRTLSPLICWPNLSQIVIDVEWLILRDPGVQRVAGTDQWECVQGFTPHVQSLVYVMFLMVVCTVTAVKVHTIKAMSVYGVKLGNSLSNNFRDCNNVIIVKKNLKNTLFQSTSNCRSYWHILQLFLVFICLQLCNNIARTLSL